MNENDTKIVKFHNPFDFDFTPEMGAMYGGVPYFVPAGGSLLCPASLADHLGTHLARHSIINKAPIRDETELDGKGKERPLWDDQAIAALKTRFVTDAYVEDKPAVVTEDQRLASKVQSLNETFTDPADKEPVIPAAPASYKDKAEVIEALKKRGITFNPRLSKDKLEQLLTA